MLMTTWSLSQSLFNVVSLFWTGNKLEKWNRLVLVLFQSHVHVLTSCWAAYSRQTQALVGRHSGGCGVRGGATTAPYWLEASAPPDSLEEPYQPSGGNNRGPHSPTKTLPHIAFLKQPSYYDSRHHRARPRNPRHRARSVFMCNKPSDVCTCEGGLFFLFFFLCVCAARGSEPWLRVAPSYSEEEQSAAAANTTPHTTHSHTRTPDSFGTTLSNSVVVCVYIYFKDFFKGDSPTTGKQHHREPLPWRTSCCAARWTPSEELTRTSTCSTTEFCTTCWRRKRTRSRLPTTLSVYKRRLCRKWGE